MNAEEVLPAAPLELSDLPRELLQATLAHMSACDLAGCSACCCAWSEAAKGAARDLLSAALGTALGTELPSPPSWARALHGLSLLTALTGPRPARTWQDEWQALRMDQAWRLAAAKGRAQVHEESVVRARSAIDAAFAEGGRLSIGVESSSAYAAAIGWKRAHGWPSDEAVAATLLSSAAASALSHALHESRRAYAASQHVLWLANERQAWARRQVAPLTYANLTGEFGLLTDDPAWMALTPSGPSAALDGDEEVDELAVAVDSSRLGGVDEAPCLGSDAPARRRILRLQTRGVAMAMVANDASFPTGAAYCCPVSVGAPDGSAQIVYEPQNSDVVCFRSAPPDRSGCHSLLETDAGVFRLPALATVTLEAVHAPGEWRANGHAVQRRCLVVSVSYG